MVQKLCCKIPLRSEQYEIEIGHGVLLRQGEYLSTLAKQFAIITHDRIASLYGLQLIDTLTSCNLKAKLFSFPTGEQYKTRATKDLLENQLLENGFGRDSCILALGGGVVTDVAGYVAGTYCRGVPLIMMPTSLLGMVDASIGGKNGVNTDFGKNLLGTIHQPKKVIIDLMTLKSLPQKEFSNGMVEVIKHALIANRSLFEMLEQEAHQIQARESNVLERVIFESCVIKKEIVEADVLERSGRRRLLNFGHTIGHALEKLTEYQLSHGEAVAIGLLVEGYLALKMGMLDQNSLDRMKQILMLYGLSLRLPHPFSEETFLKAMSMDKKALHGQPRFVILKAIGVPLNYDSAYCTPVEESLIKNAIGWMNDLCRY